MLRVGSRSLGSAGQQQLFAALGGRRHASIHAMLGLKTSAPASELAKAYRRRAMQTHPDTAAWSPSSSAATFVELKKAWDSYMATHRADRAGANLRTHGAEFLLFVLKASDNQIWQDETSVHVLRSSVANTMRLIPLMQTAAVVHAHPRKDRLDLHILAESPRHREDCRLLIDGDAKRRAAFRSLLGKEIVAAGGGTRLSGVFLAACLPYSMDSNRYESAGPVEALAPHLG